MVIFDKDMRLTKDLIFYCFFFFPSRWFSRLAFNPLHNALPKSDMVGIDFWGNIQSRSNVMKRLEGSNKIAHRQKQWH